MGFVAVLIRAPLYDSEIRLVPRKWLEAIGQVVVDASLIDVWEPRFLRYSKTKSKEDHAFGRLRDRFICARSKSVKSNRFQRG